MLCEGNTHNFLREGSLADIYGVDDEDPSLWVSDELDSRKRLRRKQPNQPNRSRRVVAGQVATLFPGDVMLLPAGVYHDVQSTARPALSITVRFRLRPFKCAGPLTSGQCCSRPFGHYGAHVAAEKEPASEGAVESKAGERPKAEGGSLPEPPAASTPSQLFQRWRANITTDAASAVPEPPQSNVDNDSLLAQDAPSRLFKKWRDATAVEGGSSEEEEKKFQELQQEVARLKALVSQYEEAASGQRDIKTVLVFYVYSDEGKREMQQPYKLDLFCYTPLDE